MTDSIGDFFKSMRLARGDSIKLVSDATELTDDYIEQIESDETIPDTDALAVLISYYDVDPDVADAMQSMISKTKEPIVSSSETGSNDDENQNKPEGKKMQINLSADMRVAYTDMVQVSETEMGVVLNFIQTAPGNVGTVVSRIGMSHTQADALRELLNKNLS